MTSYLAPHDTIVCHVEKLQMWINDTFFLLPNFAPHDKFTMYAVLSWFTLFWRKIHFVAIFALLCGANINPKILSVEQKWQIWCMVGCGGPGLPPMHRIKCKSWLWLKPVPQMIQDVLLCNTIFRKNSLKGFHKDVPNKGGRRSKLQENIPICPAGWDGFFNISENPLAA